MSGIVSADKDEMVAVFDRCTNLKGIPASSVDRQGARDLVLSGTARWVNKGTAIQMRVERNLHRQRPDLSSAMPPRVTELAAQRSSYHQGLVDGWYGRVTPKIRPVVRREA